VLGGTHGRVLLRPEITGYARLCVGRTGGCVWELFHGCEIFLCFFFIIILAVGYDVGHLINLGSDTK